MMKKLSITFSILLIPGALLAQSERLTMDDLLTVGARRAGSEQLSPDGRFFAREENGQIALVSVDGGQTKVITSSPQQKSELQWSRDGKHIAYISEGDVWIVASEGGKAQRLTHDPAGPGDPRGATDHHPHWNPNGRWILFESGRKGFDELYVVSEDGAQEKLLAAAEICIFTLLGDDLAQTVEVQSRRTLIDPDQRRRCSSSRAGHKMLY